MALTRQRRRWSVVTALLIAGSVAVAQRAAPSAESGPLKYRTWTDSTGKYKIEAALLAVTAEGVRLEKRDGQTVTVPMERLSLADQEYARIKPATGKTAEPAKQPSRRPSRAGSSRRATPEIPPPPATPSPPGAVPSAASAKWPGWRGPRRDGKSLDAGLLKKWPEGGPPLAWKVDGIGRGYASVAVSDGMVYTTGDVGGRFTVFAMDLEGQPKWKAPHDAAWTKNHPGARSTPVIDEGRLYIVSGHGLVGCYDAKTGQRTWSRHFREFGGSPPNWGYSESVLIFGNLAVVAPGGRNCIVALEKTTGRPIWASQGFAAGPQYGSCYGFEHEGVAMIAAGTEGGIACVEANSGRKLWANPFSSGNVANCPTPVYSDGYVFWANGYGKGGICLELSVSRGGVSARQAWTTRNMVCHHGGYIVHEGYIYGNNGSGWACIDLKTGRTMWQERGVGKGSLCFADGMLYLFGENGGRAALATCSPDRMEVTGSVSVQGEGPSWAHPVVAGGRLYLRYDANLYCFNVRAG